jgi:hypothetical protein
MSRSVRLRLSIVPSESSRVFRLKMRHWHGCKPIASDGPGNPKVPEPGGLTPETNSRVCLPRCLPRGILLFVNALNIQISV